MLQSTHFFPSVRVLRFQGFGKYACAKDLTNIIPDSGATRRQGSFTQLRCGETYLTEIFLLLKYNV